MASARTEQLNGHRLSDEKIQLLLKAGVERHQKGELAAANLIYEEIRKIDPTNVVALQLSGVLASQVGQHDVSIALLNKAISLKPDYVDALNNRGVIRKKFSQIEEALADFSCIISLDKNNVQALNNRGTIYKELNQYDKALADLNKAISLKPNFVEALNNRGIIYTLVNSFDKALADFENVLLVEPASFEALNNRANIFKEQGLLRESLIDYGRAISIRPDYIDALTNRGIVHQELKDFEKALEDFDQALVLKPDDHETLNNRGVVYKELGKYDKALLDYNRSISIKPDYAEGYNNRGIVLKELGRYDEAIEDYDKSIFLKPEYADPYFNQALLMLLLGDFSSAWPLYEWRWKIEQNIGKGIETSKPLWQGERDAHVFLWAEQGIGDEIMYASLIPELEKYCSKLTVKCDERLIPLFQRSFPKEINFQPEPNELTEENYDYHIPMASLPAILRPSMDSFKQASNAYLQCESKKAKDLRKTILKGREQTLIGISWNSSSALLGAHHRNIALSDMAQHLNAPGVRLVNLQYGDVADEIAKLRDNHGIKVVEVSDIDNRNDIDSLAALIMACDEIVSIDNATVHLAGALGAKTSVLLPFNWNWQWGTKGSSSYLYNSLELYRQEHVGDWKQVFKQLKSKINT